VVQFHISLYDNMDTFPDSFINKCKNVRKRMREVCKTALLRSLKVTAKQKGILFW